MFARQRQSSISRFARQRERIFKTFFLCTYVHAPAQKDLNSYIARQLEIFYFFHTCASARKKIFIYEYVRAPARAYSSCPCSRVSAKPKNFNIHISRASAKVFFNFHVRASARKNHVEYKYFARQRENFLNTMFARQRERKYLFLNIFARQREHILHVHVRASARSQKF